MQYAEYFVTNAVTVLYNSAPPPHPLFLGILGDSKALQ